MAGSAPAWRLPKTVQLKQAFEWQEEFWDYLLVGVEIGGLDAMLSARRLKRVCCPFRSLLSFAREAEVNGSL